MSLSTPPLKIPPPLPPNMWDKEQEKEWPSSSVVRALTWEMNSSNFQSLLQWMFNYIHKVKLLTDMSRAHPTHLLLPACSIAENTVVKLFLGHPFVSIPETLVSSMLDNRCWGTPEEWQYCSISRFGAWWWKHVVKQVQRFRPRRESVAILNRRDRNTLLLHEYLLAHRE